MAKRSDPPPAPVPPPTPREAWLTFFKWVLGIPLVVLGAVGIVWVGLWAVGGSDGLMNQTTSDLGTVIWWLGIIVLLYPAMLWLWTVELREALAARRDWDALTEEQRAAKLAEQAERAPVPKKRKRKAQT